MLRLAAFVASLIIGALSILAMAIGGLFSMQPPILDAETAEIVRVSATVTLAISILIVSATGRREWVLQIVSWYRRW